MLGVADTSKAGMNNGRERRTESLVSCEHCKSSFRRWRRYAGVRVRGLLLQQGGAKPGNGQVLLSPLPRGFAVAATVARVLVPGLLVRSVCQKIAGATRPSPTGGNAEPTLSSPEHEPLLAIFSAKTIMGGAILEGAGFFNLIAYMLEGQTYSLIIGLVLMLASCGGFPRGGLWRTGWINSSSAFAKSAAWPDFARPGWAEQMFHHRGTENTENDSTVNQPQSATTSATAECRDRASTEHRPLRACGPVPRHLVRPASSGRPAARRTLRRQSRSCGGVSS